MAARECSSTRSSVVSYDEESGRAVLDIHCSKGTYVRALARDLGEALGCGAYCAELRRLAIGHLDVAGAGSLDDVAADPLAGTWRLRCSDALAHLPARELEPAERDACAWTSDRAPRGGGPAALPDQGRLVCIAGPRGEQLRPLVVVDEE